MNRKSRIFLHRLAALLFFVCILFSQHSYSAFVPSATHPAQVKNTVNPENIWLKMAFMSNKDIEKAIGKKLSFREKIGIILLKRNIRKNYRSYLKNQQFLNDECFTMYLKNGDVIEVKLLQISPNEIKYQRCNKPGDPEIIISKADVFSIKDKSGEIIYSSQNESWKKGPIPDTRRVESLSLTSGILGIGSLTVGLLFGPIGLAAGITAFVLGLVSLRKYRNNNNARGQGWAITGVVAGGLWLLFGLFILVALATWW